MKRKALLTSNLDALPANPHHAYRPHCHIADGRRGSSARRASPAQASRWNPHARACCEGASAGQAGREHGAAASLLLLLLQGLFRDGRSFASCRGEAHSERD